MTRDGAIDVVSRHVEYCEKWNAGFSTFTLEACKAILFYLQHPDQNDMEGPKDGEERTVPGMP